MDRTGRHAPPKRRGRPPTGVRAAVLTAAQEILVESGVARLSTRNVAQRAGVAESSIFYHFGDRVGLLSAVVREHLPPVKEALEAVDGESSGSAREKLVALVRSLENFYARVIPVSAAIQSDAELRTSFAELSRNEDIGPHRAVQGVRAVLARQRTASGSLAGTSGEDSADLDAVALLLVGAAHQRAMQRALGLDTAGLATPEHLVDTIITVIAGS